MQTIVEMPDGSKVEFPDGMTPDQIKAVLDRQFGGQQRDPMGGDIRPGDRRQTPDEPYSMWANAGEVWRERVGTRAGADDVSALYDRFGAFTPVADVAMAAGDVAMAAPVAGASLAADALTGAVNTGARVFGLDAPFDESRGGSRDQFRRDALAMAEMPLFAGPGRFDAIDEVADAAATSRLLRRGRRAARPTAAARAKAQALRQYGKVKPDAVARRQLAEALKADGLTPAALNARRQEFLSLTRQEPTLLDIGGENTRALAQKVGSEIGPARQTIETYRDAVVGGQVDRVRDLARTTLSDNDDFFGSLDDLIEARQAEARPLYQAAYQRTVPVTDTIKRIVATPDGRAAISKAARMIQSQRRSPESLGLMRSGRGWQLGFRQNIGVTSERVVNVEVLDYVKRALDDIYTARRKEPNARRIVSDNTRRLLQEIDAVAPEYGRARAAFAGKSRMIDAMEEGRRTMASLGRASAEDIRAALGKLEPGEIPFYQAGALRGLFDRMDRITTKQIEGLVNNNFKRQKIEALFGGDKAKADSFLAALDAEARRVSNAVFASPNTGSPTHTRGVVAQFFDTVAQFFGVDTAVAYRAMGKAADKLGGRHVLKRQQDINQASAEMLTSTAMSPQERAALVKALADRGGT